MVTHQALIIKRAKGSSTASGVIRRSAKNLSRTVSNMDGDERARSAAISADEECAVIQAEADSTVQDYFLPGIIFSDDDNSGSESVKSDQSVQHVREAIQKQHSEMQDRRVRRARVRARRSTRLSRPSLDLPELSCQGNKCVSAAYNGGQNNSIAIARPDSNTNNNCDDNTDDDTSSNVETDTESETGNNSDNNNNNNSENAVDPNEMPPNLNKILISKSISTEEGTYFLTRTPMGYVVQQKWQASLADHITYVKCGSILTQTADYNVYDVKLVSPHSGKTKTAKCHAGGRKIPYVILRKRE